eukprot:3376086-Karenia_brevis.AAC.1
MHIMGWSDGGSREHQGRSAGAWILKGWIEEQSGPVILGAGASYYPRKSDSSLHVEVKAMHMM